MVNIHTGVRFSWNWSFSKFSFSRKKLWINDHMLHIEKKLPLFFYNLQKIASRYLQNYAHRKKSKTGCQKKTTLCTHIAFKKRHILQAGWCSILKLYLCLKRRNLIGILSGKVLDDDTAATIRLLREGKLCRSVWLTRDVDHLTTAELVDDVRWRDGWG